jgi:hypothetical protein
MHAISTAGQIEIFIHSHRGFEIRKFATVQAETCCDDDGRYYPDITCHFLFRAIRTKDLLAGKEFPLTIGPRYGYAEVKEAINDHLYEVRHPLPF